MRSRRTWVLNAAWMLCLHGTLAVAGEHEAELAAQFQAATPAQRATLAANLGHHNDTPAMVAALLPLLESGDADLRADTAYMLRKFYRRALEPAAPALIAALTGDQAWRVRANAAYALMALPDNANVLAAFGKCAADPDDRVRAACAKGLGALAKAQHVADGNVVSRLVADLGDRARLVRYGAAAGFAELASTDPTAIHALAARLDAEPDPWVRSAIAKAIAASGPAAEPALPALARAVPDPLPLYTANSVVGAMAAIGAPAVPTLVATLAYRAPASAGYPRRTADAAKSALARLDVPMTDALIAAMQRGPAQQRELAASVLGTKGAKATGAIPALAVALKDDDIDVRRAATTALGQLASYDTGAFAPLLDALDDRETAVRQAATRALGNTLGSSPLDRLPPALVAQLATALGARLADPDTGVAGTAAGALGRMGPQAAPALGALEAAILAPHGNNTRDAADALAAMGSTGAPALIEAVRKGASPVDRSSIGIRDRAAAGLAALGWRKQLGGREDDAVAALIDGLSDPRGDVRSDVADALGSLGQSGAAASSKATAIAALQAAMGREREDDAKRAMQSALRNWGVGP